jgi:hypothetical protein
MRIFLRMVYETGLAIEEEMVTREDFAGQEDCLAKAGRRNE